MKISRKEESEYAMSIHAVENVDAAASCYDATAELVACANKSVELASSCLASDGEVAQSRMEVTAQDQVDQHILLPECIPTTQCFEAVSVWVRPCSTPLHDYMKPFSLS